MARRRPRGGAAGRGELIGHARLDPEPTGTPGTTPGAFQGLERLGETPGEAPPPPPGENPGEAPPPPPGASPGVAAPPTVRPATRRGRKRRRSTGQRVVRWAILVVVLVLVAAGSVYGYLWYRLGQIKSVRCSTCAAQAPGAPYNVLIVGSDSRAGDSPAASKAFYMQPDPADPTKALCVDVLAPEGYGEIIGGSQRVDSYDLLRARILEHNLPLAAFEWYLDLRRYGSVPHSGFGMGIERAVAWICGLDHVRETIPFARTLNRIYP